MPNLNSCGAEQKKFGGVWRGGMTSYSQFGKGMHLRRKACKGDHKLLQHLFGARMVGKKVENGGWVDGPLI